MGEGLKHPPLEVRKLFPKLHLHPWFRQNLGLSFWCAQERGLQVFYVFSVQRAFSHKNSRARQSGSQTEGPGSLLFFAGQMLCLRGHGLAPRTCTNPKQKRQHDRGSLSHAYCGQGKGGRLLSIMSSFMLQSLKELPSNWLRQKTTDEWFLTLYDDFWTDGAFDARSGAAIEPNSQPEKTEELLTAMFEQKWRARGSRHFLRKAMAFCLISDAPCCCKLQDTSPNDLDYLVPRCSLCCHSSPLIGSRTCLHPHTLWRALGCWHSIMRRNQEWRARGWDIAHPGGSYWQRAQMRCKQSQQVITVIQSQHISNLSTIYCVFASSLCLKKMCKI